MGKNDEQIPVMLRSLVYIAEKLGIPVLAFGCCLWFLDKRAEAQDKVQREGMNAIVNALHELNDKTRIDHEALREAIQKAQSGGRGF